MYFTIYTVFYEDHLYKNRNAQKMHVPLQSFRIVTTDSLRDA